MESLLLNGKDFFRGDRNIMLNNLGAYTVKTVAVYDKLGERSLLAGRDVGDSEYVLDVRLKREYMSGFVGNLEGGGGTSSRYLGRLFGLWYTTRSRVALVGNVNNLNDSRTPGQNDSWKASAIPGDLRTQMGGLDYRVDANDGNAWTFSGNTSVQHTRSNDLTDVDQTNFLPGGDTYEGRHTRALGHNLSVFTTNKYVIRPHKASLGVRQELTYRKTDFASTGLSAAWSQESERVTQTLLEQVFAGEAASLGGSVVNAVKTQSLQKGHFLDASAGLFSSVKVPYSPDLFDLNIDGRYVENRYDTYNLYDIRHPQSGTRQYTSRYTDNSPDRRWEVSAAPAYDYLYSSTGTLLFRPQWKHAGMSKDSYLYELDRLGDAGVFGELPEGWRGTLNTDQTYMSHQTDDEASLGIGFFDEVAVGDYDKNDPFAGRPRIKFQIKPQIIGRWRRLDYRQGGVAQRVSHNGVDIAVQDSRISYIMNGGRKLELIYDRSILPVNLVRLVDVTDSRDPLNVFVGAPSLKNEATNQLSLEWSRMKNGRHRWTEIINLRYTFVNNALVNGYRYDETTGVRTYRMYNVNGNYNLRLFNSLVKTFGRKDQFDINSYTSLDYGRASDMLASNQNEMSRSKVSNFIVYQTLQWNWTIGKHKLSVNGRVNWRDTRGDNSGFNNFTATTAQYGVAGTVALPLNLSLSTDLTVYTRRGFVDRALNTSDVVWNARLSYSIKGGRWLVMLDGFDLLHQLSNVTYNVNAQGRTETYTNVLPRYALLHIQYRFMIQPKRK